MSGVLRGRHPCAIAAKSRASRLNAQQVLPPGCYIGKYTLASPIPASADGAAFGHGLPPPCSPGVSLRRPTEKSRSFVLAALRALHLDFFASMTPLRTVNAVGRAACQFGAHGEHGGP